MRSSAFISIRLPSCPIGSTTRVVAACSGWWKAQKEHPLERHRQLDRLQPRAAHIFSQQEQKLGLLRHAPPRLVFEQMDAAGLGMCREQQMAPLPVGVDLQGDAASVRQNDLLYPAARDRSLSVRRPLQPASGRQNACQEYFPVFSFQVAGRAVSKNRALKTAR